MPVVLRENANYPEHTFIGTRADLLALAEELRRQIDAMPETGEANGFQIGEVLITDTAGNEHAVCFDVEPDAESVARNIHLVSRWKWLAIIGVSVLVFGVFAFAAVGLIVSITQISRLF